MKDFCLSLAASKSGYNQKLNVIREYLQAYVLKILYAQGFFRSTAFIGGTALRFLYDLPRYSEDLDFSLTKKTPYRFSQIIKKIKEELEAAGYRVQARADENKTVWSAWGPF